jgi:hypothetical protein
MKVSVAMIEMTRSTPAARAYWWIALGVLDAMAAGGLPDATQAKMFAMRLGAQIKKLVEGTAEVSEQLLREALYLAACATAGGEALTVVRAAYRLDGMIPTATPSETERLLPIVRRLRDLLAAAKDDWNKLCAGTAAALPPFHERAAKIAEEGAATGQPDYARLTAAILEQTDQLRRDPARHNEVLALEIATALVLAESALENFQSLDAEFAHATEIVVNRLAALGRGEELGMMDLPHLDAMSRRAQERLLLASVAREIRSNLGAIETTLDAYFRDTSRQGTLATVAQPIRQIQGALMVLGQDRASMRCSPNARRRSSVSRHPASRRKRTTSKPWRKNFRRWASSSPSCRPARPISTPSSSRRPQSNPSAKKPRRSCRLRQHPPRRPRCSRHRHHPKQPKRQRWQGFRFRPTSRRRNRKSLPWRRTSPQTPCRTSSWKVSKHPPSPLPQRRRRPRRPRPRRQTPCA